MNAFQRIVAVLFIASLTSPLFSQTKLPAFFSEGMVLQQNTQVNIWGFDNPGEKITVTGSWGETSHTKTDTNGEWSVAIKTPLAGGPYSLLVKGTEKILLNDILMGEVWLCSGQSNMEMPVAGFDNQAVFGSQDAILNSKNNNIRLFNVARASSINPKSGASGVWKSAAPETTGEFSATAYFFANKLQNLLGVPIGLIASNWGGTAIEHWMDRKTLSSFIKVSIPSKLPSEPIKGNTLLYNGMIAPLEGYTIKGTIWYQGESNRKAPEKYAELFTAMINSWRSNWNQGDFPFYFVQIAPFNYGSINSALLRDAQTRVMQTVKNTGMAVTLDIGDCTCIHPLEKKKVGDRLALWALAKDYGYDKITCSGPLFKSMKVESNHTVSLTFDEAPNGFTSYQQTIKGFEIAGNDKVFYPAKAKFEKNLTISVWSDSVTSPVAVRYGYSNCPDATVYNTQGLPLTSFRTDHWPIE